MIGEVVFAAAVVASVLAVLVLAALAGLNCALAALAASGSPLLDREVHHGRMESALAANRWAGGTSAAVLVLALMVAVFGFPESSGAVYMGWPVAALIGSAVGFVASGELLSGGSRRARRVAAPLRELALQKERRDWQKE